MYYMIIAYLLAAILRCIVFHKREEKWYKGLIPFYNKYTLGKLCDNKVIGIINGILNFLTIGVFASLIILEYHMLMELPSVIEDASTFDVYQYISQTEMDFNNGLQVALGIVAALYFVSWVWLGYRFIKKNGDPVWWILVWILVPDLSYIYYSTHSKMYIPGTGMVKLKKVIINEQST